MKPPFIDELIQYLGRVLQIAVHEDDRLARRFVKTRLQSRLVAKIS